MRMREPPEHSMLLLLPLKLPLQLLKTAPGECDELCGSHWWV